MPIVVTEPSSATMVFPVGAGNFGIVVAVCNDDFDKSVAVKYFRATPAEDLARGASNACAYGAFSELLHARMFSAIIGARFVPQVYGVATLTRDGVANFHKLAAVTMLIQTTYGAQYNFTDQLAHDHVPRVLVTERLTCTLTDYRPMNNIEVMRVRAFLSGNPHAVAHEAYNIVTVTLQAAIDVATALHRLWIFRAATKYTATAPVPGPALDENNTTTVAWLFTDIRPENLCVRMHPMFRRGTFVYQPTPESTRMYPRSSPSVLLNAASLNDVSYIRFADVAIIDTGGTRLIEYITDLGKLASVDAVLWKTRHRYLVYSATRLRDEIVACPLRAVYNGFKETMTNTRPAKRLSRDTPESVSWYTAPEMLVNALVIGGAVAHLSSPWCDAFAAAKTRNVRLNLLSLLTTLSPDMVDMYPTIAPRDNASDIYALGMTMFVMLVDTPEYYFAFKWLSFEACDANSTACINHIYRTGLKYRIALYVALRGFIASSERINAVDLIRTIPANDRSVLAALWTNIGCNTMLDLDADPVRTATLDKHISESFGSLDDSNSTSLPSPSNQYLFRSECLALAFAMHQDIYKSIVCKYAIGSNDTGVIETVRVIIKMSGLVDMLRPVPIDRLVHAEPTTIIAKNVETFKAFTFYMQQNPYIPIDTVSDPCVRLDANYLANNASTLFASDSMLVASHIPEYVTKIIDAIPL